MGKLSKPQRSKKQKKLKFVDPFYSGERKDRLQKGLNQRPKDDSQEVPRKLQRLGYMIKDVKSGEYKKKSKNKFRAADAPVRHKDGPSSSLGNPESDGLKRLSKKKFAQKIKVPDEEAHDKKAAKKKKRKGLKLKTEDVEEYIDNLKPVSTFVDFKFKKGKAESDSSFMRRVNRETNTVLARARMEDKFEISDEKKIAKMVKAKKSQTKEKRKQQLSERKKMKSQAQRERREDKLSAFRNLQDKVEFGEVVHAPPVLTTLPKKAVKVDHDRPGLRMPELSKAIKRNMEEASKGNSLKPLAPRAVGQTRKRKLLSAGQQQLEDNRREDFVEAYRQMKKAKLKTKHSSTLS